MKSSFPKTKLFTTSAKTDVVTSNYPEALLEITGLMPIRLKDLVSIGIKKSRAEVAQVVTIGGTTDPTIAYSKKYTIGIRTTTGKYQSNTDSKYTEFSAVISASQGSAALDRQAIYDKLTSAINASTLNVTASAGSSGNGMTITDGSYFDGTHNANYLFSGLGKSDIRLLYDADNDGGFVHATHFEITTAAVYPVGIGADLQQMGGGIGVYGDQASGSIAFKNALSSAVSGQLYNLFTFRSIVKVNTDIAAGGGWEIIDQECYVDNGTGSATTNLAGYQAFELEIERILYGTVLKAPNSIAAFFGEQPQRQLGIGGLPTGTAGDENMYSWPTEGTSLIHSVLGTQTDVYVLVDADGLILDQDAADNDGMEFHPAYGATSPFRAVVGKGSFSVRTRVTVADVSDADELMIGFRSAVAVQANVTGYDDIIAININAGDILMSTEDANSGTRTNTDTTINLADLGVVELEVRLYANGTTKFLVNDIDYSYLITSPVTHTAGQALIPFIRCLNVAASLPGASFRKLLYINGIIERNA